MAPVDDFHSHHEATPPAKAADPKARMISAIVTLFFISLSAPDYTLLLLFTSGEGREGVTWPGLVGSQDESWEEPIALLPIIVPPQLDRKVILWPSLIGRRPNVGESTSGLVGLEAKPITLLSIISRPLILHNVSLGKRVGPTGKPTFRVRPYLPDGCYFLGFLSAFLISVALAFASFAAPLIVGASMVPAI